jgi:hypothetical protein
MSRKASISWIYVSERNMGFFAGLSKLNDGFGTLSRK